MVKICVFKCINDCYFESWLFVLLIICEKYLIVKWIFLYLIKDIYFVNIYIIIKKINLRIGIFKLVYCSLKCKKIILRMS